MDRHTDVKGSLTKGQSDGASQTVITSKREMLSVHKNLTPTVPVCMTYSLCWQGCLLRHWGVWGDRDCQCYVQRWTKKWWRDAKEVDLWTILNGSFLIPPHSSRGGVSYGPNYQRHTFFGNFLKTFTQMWPEASLPVSPAWVGRTRQDLFASSEFTMWTVKDGDFPKHFFVQTRCKNSTSIAWPSSKSKVTTQTQCSQLDNLSQGRIVGLLGVSSNILSKGLLSSSSSILDFTPNQNADGATVFCLEISTASVNWVHAFCKVLSLLSWEEYESKHKTTFNTSIARSRKAKAKHIWSKYTFQAKIYELKEIRQTNLRNKTTQIRRSSESELQEGYFRQFCVWVSLFTQIKSFPILQVDSGNAYRAYDCLGVSNSGETSQKLRLNFRFSACHIQNGESLSESSANSVSIFAEFCTQRSWSWIVCYLQNCISEQLLLYWKHSQSERRCANHWSISSPAPTWSLCPFIDVEAENVCFGLSGLQGLCSPTMDIHDAVERTLNGKEWFDSVECSLRICIDTTDMAAVAVFTCRQNSHPFQERQVQLNESIKVGRSVARARPAPNNAIFDCKVLSRNHAVLWYENGKVCTHWNFSADLMALKVKIYRGSETVAENRRNAYSLLCCICNKIYGIYKSRSRDFSSTVFLDALPLAKKVWCGWPL